MKRPPLLPVVIGTGFGAGFWPWGPGTAGAVLATAIWLLLLGVMPLTALMGLTFVLVVVLTALGTWATARLTPFWGDDPSRVVVDEMVGVWTPLLVVTAFWLHFANKGAGGWVLQERPGKNGKLFRIF